MYFQIFWYLTRIFSFCSKRLTVFKSKSSKSKAFSLFSIFSYSCHTCATIFWKYELPIFSAYIFRDTVSLFCFEIILNIFLGSCCLGSISTFLIASLIARRESFLSKILKCLVIFKSCAFSFSTRTPSA